MRIMYNRWMGVVFLILGVVLGGLAFVTRNPSFMGVLTPPALVGFGILLFTRTYFHVDEHALVVKALFGPATKIYRLAAEASLQFDGRRVFLVRKGGREMVRVSAWCANPRDWKAFRRWVELSRTQGDRNLAGGSPG